MKRIKRVISIVLLMVLCLSTCVFASEGNTIQNFVLRPENFTMNNDWKIKNDISQYANSIPGTYMESTQNNSAVTASFYINESGVYRVWALVLDSTDGYLQGYTQISIDGIKDSMRFGSAFENGFMWSAANDSYQLDEGLHTATVHMGSIKSAVAAVFITNSLSLALSETTDYESLILPYEDHIAPTFEGDILLPASDNGDFTYTIRFPEAKDDAALAACLYYFNNQLITVDEDGRFVTPKLAPASSYTFKAIAYDRLGHQTQIENTLDLSEWKLLSCTLKNQDGIEIKDLSELTNADERIQLLAQFSSTLPGRPTARFFIGIYTKDEKQLAFFNFTTVQASGGKANKSIMLDLPATITEHAENFVIKVMLLDRTTQTQPLIEGFILGEAEGVN